MNLNSVVKAFAGRDLPPMLQAFSLYPLRENLGLKLPSNHCLNEVAKVDCSKTSCTTKGLGAADAVATNFDSNNIFGKMLVRDVSIAYIHRVSSHQGRLNLQNSCTTQ